MSDPGNPNDHSDGSETQHNDEAMKHRLDQLKNRLDRLDSDAAAEQAEEEQKSQGKQAVGNALRLGTEFIAGIAVGAFIGYWIDKLAGTSYWFPIFFFLGVAAGFLNVFRTARRIQEEQDKLVASGKLDLGRDLPKDEDD